MPIGNRMAAGGEELIQEEPIKERLADEETAGGPPAPPEYKGPEPVQSMEVKPEDTAEVTEEELEALLKEFLTM